MRSIEDIRAEVAREELSPEDITVGWAVDEWGYMVSVYLLKEVGAIYEYQAGNPPFDSKQIAPPELALSEETLRRFAQLTAREIAGELGVPIEQVFEEDADV